MENLELDVDALRHAVIHRLDDSRDGGEGDGAEGDEALERAEGDRDHFGIFCRAAHEYRTEEVFRVPAILSSKENVSRCAAWCDHDARVQKNVPEAKLAVTRFGEDLSRAMDFSAAYVGDGGSLAAYMHR